MILKITTTLLFTPKTKKRKIAFQDNRKIDIFWTGRSEIKQPLMQEKRCHIFAAITRISQQGRKRNSKHNFEISKQRRNIQGDSPVLEK